MCAVASCISAVLHGSGDSMITAIREWLTTVVTAAMLVTIAQAIIGNGTLKKIAALIGALILVVALLQPLTAIQWESLLADPELSKNSVEERRQELEWDGKKAVASEVERAAAEYIRSQALVYGLEMQVIVEAEIRKDGLPVPAMVKLSGAYQQDLSDWIEKEMNIPLEQQIWES